jgi:LEA14-like dessication related protein
MKKYLPFIVIAAGAAFYFLSKGGAAKKLRIYFKDLNFGKSTGWKIPDVFARFRIVNPTNTALTVDSIAGDIFVNKNLLASIQNLGKVTIPANSEIIYPIKIQTSAFNVLNTVYQFIKNKEKVNIYFEGTVNSSGLALPIKQLIVQQ